MATPIPCPHQVIGGEGEEVAEHAPEPDEEEDHGNEEDLTIDDTRNRLHVFVEQSMLLWVPLREMCVQ